MSEIILTIELSKNGDLLLVNSERLWIALSDKDTQNLLDIVYSDSDIAHESWEKVVKRIREEVK